MEHVDGLRPARLTIGIISAGRVGTALGVALERADHVVVACSAIGELLVRLEVFPANTHLAIAFPTPRCNHHRH